MEVLISKRLCRELKDNAAVGADNGLGVLRIAADIFQVAAASYCFHQRIEHHHGL